MSVWNRPEGITRRGEVHFDKLSDGVDKALRAAAEAADFETSATINVLCNALGAAILATGERNFTANVAMAQKQIALFVATNRAGSGGGTA